MEEMTNEFNHYLVCLGSNEKPTQTMPKAREELSRLFGDILLEEELETPALGMCHNQTPFHNQIIAFSSPLSCAQVSVVLKEVEHRCGRTPEEKAQERIRMDIDLLFCNRLLIRPQELNKPHICQSRLVKERLTESKK